MSQGVNMNALTSITKALEKPSPTMDSYAKSKDDFAKNTKNESKSSFDRELNSQKERNDRQDSAKNERSQEGRISTYRKKDSSVESRQDKKETSSRETSTNQSSQSNTEAKVHKEDSKEDKALANKEVKKPMLEFLDSMEKELGVEPDRILAAFANMPQDVRSKPASITQENFVQNLQLPENQEPKAHQLYSSMLQDMEQVSKEGSRPLDAALLGEAGKEGKMELSAKEWNFVPEKEMTPVDLKKQRIAERNANLEALNDKFFNVYPQSQKANVDVSQQAVNQMGAGGPQVQMRHQSRLSPEMMDLTQAKVPQNGEIPSWLSSVNVNASQGSGQGGSGNGAFQNGEGSLQQNGEQNSMDLKAMTNEGANDDFDSMEKILKSGEVNKDITNDKVIKTNVVSANELNIDGEKVRVEELVKKADLLVKNGGGEMKIQLNPEGLGEVHMKVAVKEGKVDVQILTDNQQTKKAIESEIQSLKNVMAEGKLDLREIKVDVAQNMRNQLEDQLADQQREHARQFLDFFRQNHGSGKNAFAYASGSKIYQDSQNPEDIASQNQSQQRSRNYEDGRLSVVA